MEDDKKPARIDVVPANPGFSVLDVSRDDGIKAERIVAWRIETRRFVTQMEWALEVDLDLNELLEYEAKANDFWLCQAGPVNPVICMYDLTRFRGDVVVDVM